MAPANGKETGMTIPTSVEASLTVDRSFSPRAAVSSVEAPAGVGAGGISPGRCVPIRTCVHCRERLQRTMLRSQDGWREEADVDES